MPDDLDNLRHIEGFPIGEDEDLLGLSDPRPTTARASGVLEAFEELLEAARREVEA